FATHQTADFSDDTWTGTTGAEWTATATGSSPMSFEGSSESWHGPTWGGLEGLGFGISTTDSSVSGTLISDYPYIAIATFVNGSAGIVGETSSDPDQGYPGYYEP
ncbi:unnamed protein product, partial [marine sediment metagenome]